MNDDSVNATSEKKRDKLKLSKLVSVKKFCVASVFFLTARIISFCSRPRWQKKEHLNGKSSRNYLRRRSTTQNDINFIFHFSVCLLFVPSTIVEMLHSVVAIQMHTCSALGDVEKLHSKRTTAQLSPCAFFEWQNENSQKEEKVFFSSVRLNAIVKRNRWSGIWSKKSGLTAETAVLLVVPVARTSFFLSLMSQYVRALLLRDFIHCLHSFDLVFHSFYSFGWSVTRPLRNRKLSPKFVFLLHFFFFFSLR